MASWLGRQLVGMLVALIGLVGVVVLSIVVLAVGALVFFTWPLIPAGVFVFVAYRVVDAVCDAASERR